jgi:hypothetical protein
VAPKSNQGIVLAGNEGKGSELQCADMALSGRPIKPDCHYHPVSPSFIQFHPASSSFIQIVASELSSGVRGGVVIIFHATFTPGSESRGYVEAAVTPSGWLIRLHEHEEGLVLGVDETRIKFLNRRGRQESGEPKEKKEPASRVNLPHWRGPSRAR